MLKAWIRARRPLLELLCVLLTVLGSSALHGARAKPLTVAGHALERPDLSQWFEAARASEPLGPPARERTLAADGFEPPHPVLAGAAPSALASKDAPAGARAAASSHRVLMLGDSMIEPLQQRAAAYFRESGHKFISVIWYGSRTLDWGRGARLAHTLQTYAPSYVIVVLGSNELMARDIEQRALHVRRMLQVFGALPVIWIGPPSWREDRGFNAMLASELGDHFFRSDALIFDRKSDGIHPTDASGAYWMDSVAAWLGTRPDQTQLTLATPKGAVRHHAPAQVWPPPSR